MSAEPGPRPIKRIQRLVGYALFVAGVVVLMLIIFVAKFRFLSASSGLLQAEIARNIATGEGLTTHVLRPLGVALAGDQAPRVLFSGPLYPAVLSLPMRTMGAGDKVVALTSMAFALLTLALVGVVAARLFGTRVAAGSVALLALTVPFAEQGVTGDELAFLTLVTTALFCVLLLWGSSPRGGSQSWTVGVAVLISVAGLTRHETFALLPAVVVFWLVADRPRFWRRLVWTLLPMAVLTAPWVAYNSTLLGRPLVSAESYTLLTGTALYHDDSLVRKASAPHEHPWAIAGRNPGMIYAKLAERLYPLYHGIPLLGNPFVTTLFLAGAVGATARRRPAVTHWTVLLAIVTTGIAIALHTGHTGVLIAFVPVVTMLAVVSFVETVEVLDQPPANEEEMPAAPIAAALRNWAGLTPEGRGSGRVISLALVLLALVVAYPMVDYLFIRPPAPRSPVPAATRLLGAEPHDLIVTDVPFAVAWYAGKRVVVLPDSERELLAVEQAGFRIDAIYLRKRPGLTSASFPGFRLTARPDLPGLLWERIDGDDPNAVTMRSGQGE